jgi:phosphatidyl-myo-inositol dimannoside synthase
MRVLLVSNYFPEHVGGIETVSAELVVAYRASGHRVKWAAAATRRTPHPKSDDDIQLPSWNITEERLGFPYPLPAPWCWPRLAREVRECEVLHLQDSLYFANVLAYCIARLLHRRILVTQHISGVPYRNPVVCAAQKLAYQTVGRMVLRGADRVVFISPEVQRQLAPLGPFRHAPEIIPNGLDLSAFAAKDPASREQARIALGVALNATCLLFVGRFVEKKGISLLRQIVSARPDWTWLLVGRAGDADPTAWGFPNLRILPTMDRGSLASVYRAADLLVLPSVGEGFPVVIQEAMACGTPAVVTRQTAVAVPDALSVLFLSDRTAAAFTIAIEQALRAQATDSSNLSHRVAAYAREHWAIETSAHRYEKLF